MIAKNNGSSETRPGLVIDESRISAKSWIRIDLDDLRRQTGIGPDEERALPLDHEQMQAAQAIRRADHAARRARRAARIGTQIPDEAPSPKTPDEIWRDQTRLEGEMRARALARARSIIPDNASRAARARLIPPRNIVAVGGIDLRTPESPFPTEDSLANDNRLRAALLTALLIGMVGGYALTAQSGKERDVIEVTPPLEPGILLSHAGMQPASPQEITRAPGGEQRQPGT